MKIFDMDDDKESLSFGRYLKGVRLEKKISLEEVAAQTRIGLGNLLLLEQEDHEQLPAEVFVKGFLRSYAAAVGADGDEAVRRYESRPDVVQKKAESEASGGKSRSRSRRKLIIAFALLVGVIGGAIAVASFLRIIGGAPEPLLLPPPAVQDHPGASKPKGAASSAVVQDRPDASKSEGAVSSAAVQDSPGAPKSQDEVSSAAEPAKKVSEKMSLQITAHETTWIKVIIDEKDSTEYNLNPGDDLELEATTGYNLLIGNAGGIKITLNGQPVAIAGKSGQVVTMHLP